ncbi:hypothetical protein WAI453_001670 [Rhynchosporium graminicola]
MDNGHTPLILSHGAILGSTNLATNQLLNLQRKQSVQIRHHHKEITGWYTRLPGIEAIKEWNNIAQGDGIIKHVHVAAEIRLPMRKLIRITI